MGAQIHAKNFEIGEEILDFHFRLDEQLHRGTQNTCILFRTSEHAKDFYMPVVLDQDNAILPAKLRLLPALRCDELAGEQKIFLSNA